MLNWDVQEVRKYKDKPFDFKEQLDVEKDLKERYSDIISAQPVDVSGNLFNDRGLVISDVKVAIKLTVPSTRSLDPVDLNLEFRINEAYNIDNIDTEEIEDYAIIIPIDDDTPTINVYESVIDNILLNIPTQVLTEKEKTEDIMPSGKNWTVISEDEFKKQKEEEHVNPEFAKLKNLFKDEDQ
ncbi:YceD family protein [Companilactobacillus furfuricola]|uniref:YceD family protein n=1 Tax=Companilactobacillus furfuricola TaxID=1462575 RepID=UPI000F790808|nr:YceD family protein [Companilactobacillus furfuricola]